MWYNLNMKISGLVITTAIFLLSPLLASAQLTGLTSDSVELNISPQNPGPNQSVKATLVSYSTDLNRADITWSINGDQESSGKGIKTFTFSTGNLGTRTTLDVLIISEDGYPILKNVIFNPASVSLLVEAASYTPPFYRGRAYFPYQGSARIIAVPSFVDENGKQISSSNLIFEWKDGGRNLANSSGVGKNILNYKGNIPIRAGGISVIVSSIDQKYVANNGTNIEPTETKAVLYENDPEYGMLYNKALTGSIKLNKEEMNVVAVPYYFNVEDPSDYNLKYEWKLNSSLVKTSGNSIVLKSPSGGSGNANLALQLSNTVDIFQFASAGLNINFGATAKNIFGF